MGIGDLGLETSFMTLLTVLDHTFGMRLSGTGLPTTGLVTTGLPTIGLVTTGFSLAGFSTPGLFTTFSVKVSSTLFLISIFFTLSGDLIDLSLLSVSFFGLSFLYGLLALPILLLLLISSSKALNLSSNS